MQVVLGILFAVAEQLPYLPGYFLGSGGVITSDLNSITYKMIGYTPIYCWVIY